MTLVTTSVAALGLRLGALAADVTRFVAVVASLATGSGAGGRGALARKVTNTTAVVAAAATRSGTAKAATGATAGGRTGTSNVAVLTALVALATGTASSRGGVGGALTALQGGAKEEQKSARMSR